MSQQKQINFTIVPDEQPGDPRTAHRTYANFCAVAHSPFDMTITFCDVHPLTEHDIRNAETSQTVRVPIVARIALPFGIIPGLISALQEQLRAMQEAQAGEAPHWPKGPKEPLH
jgi:hypothetical protein